VILPTKGIQPRAALLSVGAEVIRLLNEPKSVSRLWDDFRRSGSSAEQITFDWFVLSLDLLFVFGAIELARGRVRKVAGTHGTGR
jgi:hypothetical protein